MLKILDAVWVLFQLAVGCSLLMGVVLGLFVLLKNFN
jgi:uncharacterized protein YneF (UPF0154 family)